MAEVVTKAVGWNEAAAMYGVKVGRIKAAIASGDLRAKKVGRFTRIDVDDLDAWWQSLPDA